MKSPAVQDTTDYRTLWIEALRSGDHQQGTSTMLRDSNGAMCCLGVACEVVDPDGWEADITEAQSIFGPRTRTELYFGKDGSERFDASPPQWVMDLVGIDRNTVNRLINLNDCERKTFNQIADWLEAKWEAEEGRPRSRSRARAKVSA